MPLFFKRSRQSRRLSPHKSACLALCSGLLFLTSAQEVYEPVPPPPLGQQVEQDWDPGANDNNQNADKPDDDALDSPTRAPLCQPCAAISFGLIMCMLTFAVLIGVARSRCSAVDTHDDMTIRDGDTTATSEEEGDDDEVEDGNKEDTPYCHRVVEAKIEALQRSASFLQVASGAGSKTDRINHQATTSDGAASI